VDAVSLAGNRVHRGCFIPAQNYTRQSERNKNKVHRHGFIKSESDSLTLIIFIFIIFPLPFLQLMKCLA
jgi:hypothetical protein